MKVVCLLVALTSACGPACQADYTTTRGIVRIQKRWKHDVESKFDLVALLEFVRHTSVSERGYQGVDFTAGQLDPQWEFRGESLRCGDWWFYFTKGDTFTLLYSSDYAARGFAVSFECIRDAESSFRVIQISKDPHWGWRS
jgi:hypothetical protein